MRTDLYSFIAQCMCSVELKPGFITRVSVVTAAYLSNSESYTRDFLKAVLLLKVPTPVL